MRVYPPPSLEVTFASISTDESTASVGTWLTLLSIDVGTRTSPALAVGIELAVDVTIGGAWRVLINGGAYSNDPLIERKLPVGSDVHASMIRIFAVDINTSYTLSLQVVSEGILSSVACNAASDVRHGAFLRAVV